MANKSRETYIKDNKKKKRKKAKLFIFVPLLVIILAGIGYGATLYSKAKSVADDSYEPIDRDTKRETRVDPDIDDVSILFIGVDDSEKRSSQSGTTRSRSDALMVATLNEKEKSVKLLSIPRDSYVYIPERGYKDKITHAHYFGGVTSTLDTVENLLEIPIDYYVKMNFDAFMDVVDALGGIDVDVPVTFTEQNSKDKAGAIHLEEGYQELDGEEALALARTRKIDNDIERGKRQQLIMQAIMKKAISVEGITKYSKVMEAVGSNMTTDLSFSDMQSLIAYATADNGLQVETLTLTGYDGRVDGKYIYELDEAALAETKSILQQHLGVSSSLFSDSDSSTETPTETDTTTDSSALN
ncbi:MULTISPECIES: LCP family protein [Bacillaceae]|uniref:LCP family protein n=1 Tax=Bacillaceae TaxID=186817 RepID=UPI001F162923|nr:MULTISPECIES: LCP family protein [Bacillaceae]MCF2647764.1 LCP family protein [Niallia circulans]CAI9385739.1 Polyisoprenyl-teichoic acid--peptidoglycan teichoic acid transferase TagT [Bacillus sp. T2.9-1]